MTTFSRYYDQNGLLQETTMDELEELIKDEKNKGQIADLIYHRYYDRYLKIFDFEEDAKTKEYDDRSGVKRIRKVFNMEYKNGFAMMVNCCLLIETLAAFFKGIDKTPNRSGDDFFNYVFAKAGEYNNELEIFCKKNIYSKIRNGLLHQGETYNDFKIRRDSELFDETNKIINATLFHKYLNQLLESYCKDLADQDTEWDGDLWDKCRVKLRYIIGNTKPKS